MALEPKSENIQILKCREDQGPVYFVQEDGDSEQLALKEGSACNWDQGTSSLGVETLRKRIEPWLTALVQSDHLSLLLGSGLTHAVHGIACGGPAAGMSTVGFEGLSHCEGILRESKRTAQAAGRGEGNIEDQIRVANELLRGLQIIESQVGGSSTDAKPLADYLEKIMADFSASILESETSLAEAEDSKRHEAFNYLVTFLMSFASRNSTRDRLHVFTTNYDRLIEAGADVAGLHLLDRFVGGLTPVLRSSRLDLDLHYNPPGIRGEPRSLEGVARFTKLHGSVDWVEQEKSIRRIGVPFGAKDLAPYLNAPGLSGVNALGVMIHPNAAKDRETAGYPYVDLFRDLAASCCRPNHTLFTYGYSFGDEHINRVIEDMLTVPSTHLVIMSHGDGMNRIKDTIERIGRPAQTTLLIGSYFGDLKRLVDWFLPKPAIDRTTFRMAELLKTRFGAENSGSQQDHGVRFVDEEGKA